ncbi:MAG: hypothetical protein IK071_10320 [Lachnospiraceae bacterium]|nr:hypothetical protein [Lachnospiraceae bacterium]
MSRKVSAEVKKERVNAIKKTLKSMIFPTVFLALIAVGIFLIIKLGQPVEDEPQMVPDKYDGSYDPITLENDKLIFTLYPETTDFTVTVKETGKVWYSTAQDADSDTIALSGEKDKLKSDLLISYKVETGSETTLNSYDYSATRGIYNIESDSNSITIHYSIGDIDREYRIPPVLTEAKYKEILKDLDFNQQIDLKGCFPKKDIKKIKDEDEKAALIEKFPSIENEVLYVATFSNSNVKQTIEKLFYEIGFTDEELEECKALANLDNTSDKPIFKASVTYRLEGSDLVVDVPMSSLDSPHSYRITTLSLLPYMGAGGKVEDGFLLIPEGGGAILRFNNGKKDQNNYYANMYGRDICLKKDDLVHDTRVYYNLFGISEGNNSFLCILENGASYASIQADTSGRLNNYNYVNAVYTIKAYEKYDIPNATSDLFGFNENLPEDEHLTQRYRFVNSGSYVDMAKEYGNYMKEKYGNYLTLNDDTSAPVVFDVVGAADKVRQIMGIPVSRPLPLTTFSQAEEILKDLKASNIDNASVRLSGWCNGGVNQRVLSKTKVLSKLGGKKGLNRLTKTAQELGYDLYLNGITQYAYDSDIFDGFFSYTDAAKVISKQRAELHVFSAVTYALREGTDSYYLLHPDKIYKMMDNLKAAADKYNANVAYEDVGIDLSSDFYRKKPVSREQSMVDQTEKLKTVKDSGTKQMINMGNIYAAPYVDMIVESDLAGTKYTILDEHVPFLELALHGYINYTGEPLNISGNYEEELLTSAEYGAGLMFTIMNESPFTLQDTLYTMYYGCDYSNWKDRIKATYEKYNRELGHIFNQEMVDHDKLTDEVSCTVYKDGTKVYVNYSYEDYTAPDGTVIPARDYKAVR